MVFGAAEIHVFSGFYSILLYTPQINSLSLLSKNSWNKTQFDFEVFQIIKPIKNITFIEYY